MLKIFQIFVILILGISTFCQAALIESERPNQDFSKNFKTTAVGAIHGLLASPFHTIGHTAIGSGNLAAAPFRSGGPTEKLRLAGQGLRNVVSGVTAPIYLPVMKAYNNLYQEKIATGERKALPNLSEGLKSGLRQQEMLQSLNGVDPARASYFRENILKRNMNSDMYKKFKRNQVAISNLKQSHNEIQGFLDPATFETIQKRIDALHPITSTKNEFNLLKNFVSKTKLGNTLKGDRVTPIKSDISKLNEKDLESKSFPIKKHLQIRFPQWQKDTLFTIPKFKNLGADLSILEKQSLKAKEAVLKSSGILLPGEKGNPFQNPIKTAIINGAQEATAFEVMTPPQKSSNERSKYDLLRPLDDVNDLVLAIRTGQSDGIDTYTVLHHFGAADRGFKLFGSTRSMDDLSLPNTRKEKMWKDDLNLKFSDPSAYASQLDMYLKYRSSHSFPVEPLKVDPKVAKIDFALGNEKNGRLKSFEAEDASVIRSMSLNDMQLSDYYKLDAETRQRIQTSLGLETSIEKFRNQLNDPKIHSYYKDRASNFLSGQSYTAEDRMERIKQYPIYYGLNEHFVKTDWNSPEQWKERMGTDKTLEGLETIQKAVKRVEGNPEMYGLSEEEIQRIQKKGGKLSAAKDASNLLKLYEVKVQRDKMIQARDNHFHFNLNAVINNPDLSHIKPVNPRQVIVYDGPLGGHDKNVHDVLKYIHPNGKTTLAHSVEEVSRSDGAFIQMSLAMVRSNVPFEEFKPNDEKGQKQVMVISAGNFGSSVDPFTKMQHRRILVGATLADGITMSDYSNQPIKDPELQKRFMVAPGGFKDEQGTSFAAPMVSGALSKVLDYFPHISPMQGQDILLYAADPILIDKQGKPYDLKNVPAGEVETYLKQRNIPLDDLKRGREKYGMGRLNVKRALDMAERSADSPNPAISSPELSAPPTPERKLRAPAPKITNPSIPYSMRKWVWPKVITILSKLKDKMFSNS